MCVNATQCWLYPGKTRNSSEAIRVCRLSWGQTCFNANQAESPERQRMTRAKICQYSGTGGIRLVVTKKIGPRKGRTCAKAGMNSQGPRNSAIQAKGRSSQ